MSSDQHARMNVPHGHKQAAVLSVLKADNQFLLLKRNRPPNKHKYTPVGGKVEAFESPVNAVVRETFEETGLSTGRPQYCGLLVETSPEKYNWICFVYLTKIDYTTPPDCNEGQLEWISFSDLLNIPTPATDWHIYNYILKGKTFMFSAEYDAKGMLLEMREEIEDKIIYRLSHGSNRPDSATLI